MLCFWPAAGRGLAALLHWRSAGRPASACRLSLVGKMGCPAEACLPPTPGGKASLPSPHRRTSPLSGSSTAPGSGKFHSHRPSPYTLGTRPSSRTPAPSPPPATTPRRTGIPTRTSSAVSADPIFLRIARTVPSSYLLFAVSTSKYPPEQPPCRPPAKFAIFSMQHPTYPSRIPRIQVSPTPHPNDLRHPRPLRIPRTQLQPPLLNAKHRFPFYKHPRHL